MRKRILIVAAATLALAACEEWQPVFTGEHGDVYMYEAAELEVTSTIAHLKDLYAKYGVLKIQDDDMVIAGKVISDDHSGNVYRELYIQDETGVISVKIGLSSLYSDYKLGQTVYVKCSGLTIGQYNGMPQLGVEDPTGEYETSYLDNRYLIDAHVIRGAWGDPVPPRRVTEDELAEKKRQPFTYLSLSPIFDSISKQGYHSAFTAEDIAKAYEEGIIDHRVMALGGITFDKLQLVKQMGFGGAMILGDAWK